MTGFEPATPSSRTTYATGLRYIPNGKTKIFIAFIISANIFDKRPELFCCLEGYRLGKPVRNFFSQQTGRCP